MSEEMFADLMESAIEMVEMENAMSTEKFKVTDNKEVKPPLDDYEGF